MSFGDNLKRIRTEKKLKQGELATKVGIHANHISRYERNEATPSAEVLKQFAEALDVSADNLLFGNQKDYLTNSIKDFELIKLIQRIEILTENEKAIIKDLISAYLFRNETRTNLAS
jgi:transcriptional regulator with XRE-family HTH domain